MNRTNALAAWFSEASNLRTFAFWNIWFWLSQHPILTVWFIVQPKAFGDAGPGLFYLAQISVAALWLSSLAWWQSTRVEERQIETEEAT